MNDTAQVLATIAARFGRRLSVGDKLGEGAMGAVYRVQLDGRAFALKVLLPTALASPDVLRRFLLEGRILKEMDHPNVLRVHEIGEEPAAPFLLCEIVEGEGLDRILAREGALPWTRALALMEGLLAGLAHAHGRGIIHRDVKPSNVLVDREDRPRVADFGIAKVAGLEAHRTSTGMVMGTPAYIAPELVLGEVPTQASDVYSAGVVLYELVTGHPPFEGDEVSTLLSMKVKAHAVPLASRAATGVPLAIDRLITMAMAREPIDRLPTAAAFARELADTRKMIQSARATASATAAVRVPTGERARATGRIPRATAAGVRAVPPPAPRPWAAVALLVALAGLAVGLVALRRAPAARARGPVTVTHAVTSPAVSERERVLRDALVEARPGSEELERRLGEAAALEPARSGVVLHEAWRRAAGPLRRAIGDRLSALPDAHAVPALCEVLAAPPGADPKRTEAARALSALLSGAQAPDPADCPAPEVVVSQACTLLKQACVPGSGETTDAVRAAVRVLGWLAYPETACVEDIVRAPGCVGWVGDGFADDPARETRAALARIDSRAARRQLEVLPPVR